MRPKKLYISGPMTGIPEHNHPAFNGAAKKLRAAGYEVISPAELDGEIEIDMGWIDCLKRDIREVVECGGIATLPGWQDSKGASLEVHIAKELGFEVYPVEHFLEEVKA